MKFLMRYEAVEEKGRCLCERSSLSPGCAECSCDNRGGGGGKGKNQQGLILVPYLNRGIQSNSQR